MLYSWKALEKRLAAMNSGKCPEARTCYDKEDLAEWFRSMSIAAGVNARSR